MGGPGVSSWGPVGVSSAWVSTLVVGGLVCWVSSWGGQLGGQ